MAGNLDGTPTRRRLLQLGVGAALGGVAPAIVGTRTASARPLRNGQLLPVPQLGRRGSYTVVAGLRPFRSTGVRLELDPLLGRDQGKHVIHNYGHGGAGITLSLACAARVARLVTTLGGHGPALKIAVIGSGVAGLTVARDLMDLKPRPHLRILTRDQSIEGSTSWIAGGQFAPSGILRAYHDNPQELRDLVREAFVRIKGFSIARRQAYGIRQRFNYSLADVEDLKFSSQIIGSPNIGNLPFDGLKTHDQGYEYNTWLIEPQLFLPQLLREVRAMGGRVQWGHPVTSMSDLLQLPETVIINCSGLGSYDLVGDHTLSPIEGQLAVLKNPHGTMNYFVSGGCGGATSYMFCRSKDIVIGGSTDTRPIGPGRIPVARVDPGTAQEIVTRMMNFLAGRLERC